MMLDVVNEIEGGAHLLSSKRHFVDKIDVKMLQNDNGTPTPWKGHPLTLLLFDDVLEVCVGERQFYIFQLEFLS